MMRHRVLISLILVTILANSVILVIKRQRAQADTATTVTSVNQSDEVPTDGLIARIPDAVPVAEQPPAPAAEQPKAAAKATTKAPAAASTPAAPSTPDTPATPATSTVAMTHFGAIVRPYGLKDGSNPYTKDQLTAQLDLAYELGVTDIRANVEQEEATNDDVVNESLARGIQPILVLEPPTGYLDQDIYHKAYNFGRSYASRYKGKVHTYQLANEASGMAIRTGYAGDNSKTDYDPVKYQITKDTIRGLSEGVHDTDPSAKRIVSANWLGTGIFDLLIADEVDFDIFGYDWYSDMGTDMIKKLDSGATLNIPEYLRDKYNKPFWIVEANRREGTNDLDFDAQANYIKTLMQNVASHHNTAGFFIYSLTDQCSELDQSIGHLGLVSIVKQDSGLCTISDKKPAFQTFKDLISKYK